MRIKKLVGSFFLSILGCSVSLMCPLYAQEKMPESVSNVQESANNNALPSSQSAFAIKVLQAAEQAMKELNYEISYIYVRHQAIEPLRFRHANLANKTYAYLTYLSGIPKEAIQRGDIVSYFEPNITPFSISHTRIHGLLPSLYQTDVTSLASFYDFIPIGNGREAGMKCQLIRLVSKEGDRYSYVLWVDQKSKLIVRGDVLDKNGNLIEQYRALTLGVNDKIGKSLRKLDKVNLPPIISSKIQTNNEFDWTVGWLPNGFSLLNTTRHRLSNTTEFVESRLYSDGLFDFSIYVSKLSEVGINQRLIRQGKRTLYSDKLGHYEVSIVGALPPTTARRIVRGVQMDPKFKAQSPSSVKESQ